MKHLGWVIAWSWLLGVGFGASLAAGDGQPDANEYRVTGSRSALWVVRRRGDKYDIVAKPISKEWTWQARSMQGRPLQVAATDRRLVALFSQRSVLIHSLDTDAPLTGASPADPNWPAATNPVAVCDANGIGQDDGSIVAIVPVRSSPAEATAPPATTRPASGDEADDLGSAEPRPVSLAVFLYQENGWRQVGSLPCATWREGEPVLATVVDRTLYLSLGGCEPQPEFIGWPEQYDPADTPAVMRFDGERWVVTLTRSQLAGMTPTGMTSLDTHLVLVGRSGEPAFADPNAAPTTAPATRPATQPNDGLKLFAMDIHSGAWIRQDVTSADGVDTPGPAALAGVTRLGDRIILAWKSAEPNAPLLLGSVGLNGQIARTEPLTIFSEPEPNGDSAMVIEIMMGAVLVAMFVPLFILRPRGPQKPFALPKLYQPGNLLKRLIAGAIDLLPFMAVASAALGAEPASLNEVWEMANVKNHPVEHAYWMVAMLGCYVAYGVVMEYRFGATVGKLITRLRVVGNGGDEADLRACFLRNIVKIVELSTFLVALLIVLPIVTPYRQRLGDMLARTSVVEKDSIELDEADKTFDVPEEMKSDGSENGPGSSDQS